jgi:hypothetical protein
METDPVSETLCSFAFVTIPSKNPVIPIVTHHRQNPLTEVYYKYLSNLGADGENNNKGILKKQEVTVFTRLKKLRIRTNGALCEH